MAVIHISNEKEMLAFGQRLASLLLPGMLCFFRGPLGAGKTTCVRGLLRGLGYEGAVNSPTYTLLEEYPLMDKKLVHFDLYRLEGEDALESLGFRDYINGQNICLLEWPEKCEGELPQPDVDITIHIDEEARRLDVRCNGEKGKTIMSTLYAS